MLNSSGKINFFKYKTKKAWVVKPGLGEFYLLITEISS